MQLFLDFTNTLPIVWGGDPMCIVAYKTNVLHKLMQLNTWSPFGSCLSQCSIAMKRHHEHKNIRTVLYQKTFNWGLLIVSEV